VLQTQLPPAEYPGTTPPAAPTVSDDLFSNGFLLKLGFSFIVGLAVGFALKVALRLALVVGGVLLIALFGLQYAGIIDVDWTGMQTHYDGLAAWLAAYAGALKDFMVANLSSAASFSAGLILGLRF